jgi:hypothetical protein
LALWPLKDQTLFTKSTLLISAAFSAAAAIASDGDTISCETLVPKIVENSKLLKPGTPFAESIAQLGVRDCVNTRGEKVAPVLYSGFGNLGNATQLIDLNHIAFASGGAALKTLVFKNGLFVGAKDRFETTRVTDETFKDSK